MEYLTFFFFNIIFTFKMILGLSFFWFHEVEPKAFAGGWCMKVTVKSSEYWWSQGIYPTGCSQVAFNVYDNMCFCFKISSFCNKKKDTTSLVSHQKQAFLTLILLKFWSVFFPLSFSCFFLFLPSSNHWLWQNGSRNALTSAIPLRGLISKVY